MLPVVVLDALRLTDDRLESGTSDGVAVAVGMGAWIDAVPVAQL